MILLFSGTNDLSCQNVLPKLYQIYLTLFYVKLFFQKLKRMNALAQPLQCILVACPRQTVRQTSARLSLLPKPHVGPLGTAAARRARWCIIAAVCVRTVGDKSSCSNCIGIPMVNPTRTFVIDESSRRVLIGPWTFHQLF